MIKQHHIRALEVREEFFQLTGVLPPYPWSIAAREDLLGQVGQRAFANEFMLLANIYLDDQVPEGPRYIDLDSQVSHPVKFPADPWIEIMSDAKDDFEVDGAALVFSTWRM